MADKIARFRMPDGRVAKFSVPEGTSPQQALTLAENYFGSGLTMAHQETMGESMAKAAEEMGPGKAIIAGIGTKAMDIDTRLRQVLGMETTPQDANAVRMGRTATGPVLAGRIAADLGISAAAAPAGIAGQAAAGAAQSFLTEPVLEGESGAQNALRGGALSAAGYGGAKLAQGLVRPVTPTADVAALAKEGIIPSVGESAAATGSVPGRIVGRMEEAATSVPGIGQVISGARRRAGVDELNRAVFARATPRGVEPTTQTGRAGLDETYDKISDVYNNALQRIGVVRPDQRFSQDISSKVNGATVGLSRDQIATLQDALQRTINGRNTPVAGAYTAEIAKQVDAELGQLIRSYSGSESSRMLAEPVRQAQIAWRDLIRRNAPDADTARSLDDANRAFANYVRAERAVAKPAAAKGEFNQTQLAQAVRETAGGGARKAQFARGNALMEDLSDPAKAVLSSNLGESGTVPRSIAALLMTGGAGGAAYGSNESGMPAPVTMGLGALALSPLLYSRAGSRYAIGDLVPGQNTLAELISSLAPYGGGIGRAYAAESK